MSQSNIEAQITKSRILLCNPYAYLDENGGFSAVELSTTPSTNYIVPMEALIADRDSKQNPYAHIEEIQQSPVETSSKQPQSFGELAKDAFKLYPENQTRSDSQIEQQVETLKQLIWKCRDEIGGSNLPSDPIKLLNPSLILEKLGFAIGRSSSLGTFQHSGKSYEVAGEIDRDSNTIRLSDQEPHISRNFTLAHELGHALMHAQTGLHRDPRPEDRVNFEREQVEKEADKFATFFLMPEKLVRAEFKNIFMVDEFILNDDRSYALNPSRDEKINRQIQSRRGLARLLAQTDNYNGDHLEPLCRRFNVSIESMAIRLEELEIV